jgi:hypothetical protein
MEPKSPVFKKHYKDYLQRLASLDFEPIALKLGGQVNETQWGKSIVLSLFGSSYEISPQGIIGPSGEKPMYDICIILCRYLLMCPKIIPHDRAWVAFRDLKDSGPLTVYFRDNVEQVIADRFTGNLGQLKQCIASLKGYSPDLDVSYDLAMQVDALPQIPMVLLFNDKDESFPVKCSILFQRQVEIYLDAECIAMLGYRLSAQLRQGQKNTG